MCTTNDNAHFSYTPEAIHSILHNNYVDWDTTYGPINDPTWLVKSRMKDKSTLVFTFDSSEKALVLDASSAWAADATPQHTKTKSKLSTVVYVALLTTTPTTVQNHDA